MDRCIALIPAYEPTDVLPDLARQLQEAGFTVVIVDDGSGPAFAPIFQQTQKVANVLSYQPNCGKGHALKVGFSYIAEQYPEQWVVITMDADGQHTLADAEKIAACVGENPQALTLGVRDFQNGTPLRSRLGNGITRLVYRLSTGCPVRDTQTGLRGCTVALMKVLQAIEGERYEYEMNVLMQCPRQQIPIVQFPIATIYFDGNRGSHFHTVRDAVRIYLDIFKFAASSLLAFVLDYGLYSLFSLLLGNLGKTVSIPVANVSARLISAGTNFTINKRFVFQNQDSIVKTGAQYFLLAAGILCANTFLLSVLVNRWGCNQYLAKLITEIIFFVLSWLIQRFWIFRNKKSC